MLLRIKTEFSTFTEAFKTFQAYNQGRNLSKGTLSYYETGAKSILAFMGGDFQLSEFNNVTLDGYIQYLRSNGNKDTSINSRLRALRAMFSFFSRRGLMPDLEVQMIKADKPIKEAYTDAELKLLLRKPSHKKCDFDDYRNWVVINYLLATGNRLSTIVNIKVGDVNLEEDEIILRHTKNRTQQIIPIAAALKSILIEYLRYWQAKSQEDYLFCTRHGEQMTPSGMINAISRYNRRRGVSRTSIHLFRHTFAKKWIMNGGDILRLQKLLGHKTLDMVKEYVALYGQDLKKDYDKFNPLSSMCCKQYIKLEK